MKLDLMLANDSFSNAIASLKAAHHKAANGYYDEHGAGEMVKRDQFGEMVMRDLLKQAHELRQRLTEVMMAANCPTI